ncbi:MAG TPA: MFS transporter [Candidatus Dormibacteraeota bacterium]|nr:MFS transporter [Candidatus Dormibacteraeota bacterium]
MSTPATTVKAARSTFLLGYRRLLGRADVRRLVISSMVARLPSAMLPLVLLLLVHQRTGSLAAAGLVVGAFGLGRAVVSPAIGALVDRHGQAGVLLVGTAVQAVLLVALLLAVEAQGQVAIVAVLAAAAGSATPPVQACLRALWPVVALDESAREAAYSFDATSQETIWIAGPVLVAALLTAVQPAALVVVCAVIGCAGVALFASSPISRGWRGARRQGRLWPGALAGGNLRALVATSTFAGATWGALTFGLTALAVELGASRASGLLLAGVSIGSISGGLIYGSRAWPWPTLRRYRLLLVAMAACGLPLLFVHSVAVALPLSLLAGLPLAAVYAGSYVLTGRSAVEGTTTEAFTWTSSAFALGVAMGNGSAGGVSQAFGVHAAFGLACAASVIAVVAALWVRDPVR